MVLCQSVRELSVAMSLQDELVTALRGDGRKQAAQRMLRQKKDGQLVSYDSSGFETASG